MLRSLSFSKLLCRLIRDDSGSIAMMFCLLLVPFTLAAGVGLDFAQAQNFRNALQGAADSAVLAGASAYTSTGTSGTANQIATNYMNKALPGLPPHKTASFTVTPGTQASGGNTTGYTVGVTATATVSTAFMQLVGIKTTTVSVTATAENPVTTASINMNGFSSNACDANTVYWYLIPAGSKVSTYVPPTAALTQLWTNTVANPPAPPPFTLSSSSQQIGFALKNVTGGNCGSYGNNGYGGKYNSTHMFYSNLFPPSSQTYASVKTNNSLQVAPLPSGKTQAQVVAGLPVKTFTSDPTMAAPTCGQLNGQPYIYAWNDMGGTKDDLDYNDAAYTFTCTGANGSGTTSAGSRAHKIAGL